METPVVDFIKNYSESKSVRLHVPGHKGKGESISFSADITEISGADVLYHEDGILKQSQDNATKIFGSQKTLYSTEGSSLCIRAMLALVKIYAQSKGEKPYIVAGRNAHKVFMTASALLDIDLEWLYPRNNNGLVCTDISAEYLESIFCGFKKKPTAVYITSPDYLGNIADIRGISAVCRKYGVLFICDNAHGSYLHFLEEDMHPISSGADMCCDSAHKTLPVLTGGAYLHISEKAPAVLAANAEKTMALFASTSPSYLTLMSLDSFNSKAIKFRYDISATVKNVAKMKASLISSGYEFVGDEYIKLTIRAKKYGYSGYDIAEILRNNGFECEFFDPDFVVMMFTPEITEKEITKLQVVLLSIEKKNSIDIDIPECPVLCKALSVNEALFRPSVRIPVEHAVGRILASPGVSCPPAVPIAVCGEVLTEDAVNCFKYYGIDNIDVVIE